MREGRLNCFPDSEGKRTFQVEKPNLTTQGQKAVNLELALYNMISLWQFKVEFSLIILQASYMLKEIVIVGEPQLRKIIHGQRIHSYPASVEWSLFLSVTFLLQQSFYLLPFFLWASLVAQLVKNPPAMRETWVQSLNWEDPLEEGMETHSSIVS